MKIFEKHEEGKKDPWLRDTLDIENLFSSNWINAFDRLSPSLNIKEDNSCFCIDIIAPYYRKEDFSVNIEDKIITITAGTTIIRNATKNNIISNSNVDSIKVFTRSFRLPDNIKEDLVTAIYKEGTLTLTIPKQIPVLKKEVAVE